MATASRDRAVIDMRGPGDAVRQALAERNPTVPALARQVLLHEIGRQRVHETVAASALRAPLKPQVKLTLRLRHTDAEALILAAGGLDLS